MSLMFRKAILPRNVSLLKYFKGRPLATAANKKNNGVLSTAVPCHRNLKYKARPLRVGTVKTERVKPLTPFKIEGRGGGEATRLRFCVSSPDIVPLSRTKLGGSPIISGPASSINYDTLLMQRTGSLPNVPCSYFHTSHYVSKCKPAPCPCPGCPGCCNCLPPPCNTAPKCIQYMTGYYYYPYGFWFCGPYHVTGTCVPAGPCTPGSPCGPCCGPPCPPCGPCGPCCSPCVCPPPPPPKPSCPCPKCCTCLSPIPTAVVGGDPEPRCQSVQVPPLNPKSKSKPIEVSYPLPRVDPPQRERAPTPQSKGGISKFFPFNAVPALVPATRVPHSSVHVCPYSTQPLTQSCPQTQYSGCTRLYPEHNPVYCTPCIKARTRPRIPPSYYFSEKAKKSNYYEKRSESRSPIHHKRVKRVNCELCSVLENPRGLLTKEQRDKPAAFPGTFQYTNIPNYKNPFPTQPNKDTSDYREYETKTE